MRGEILIAKVAVSGASYSFDNEYSYTVPDELAGSIVSGMRVTVPFGSGNRHTVGLVMRMKTSGEADSRIKPILSAADSEPLVNSEMLSLISWLKNNTFCTYFDAYRSMVPSGFGYKFSSHYSPANVAVDESELDEQELSILQFMKKAKNQREIDEFLDLNSQPKLRGALSSLIDKGYVEQTDTLRRRVGDETVRMVRLDSGFAGRLAEGSVPKLTKKQKKVVDLLAECGCASVKEVCYMTSCTSALITRMKKNGMLADYKNEVLRDAIGKITDSRDPEDILLNDEQQAAYEGIMELVSEGKPSGALLYGVTGSGKTAVFFRLIDSVLKLGKTAMMLVPEISLTPQMLRKFKTYFGSSIAVLHSSLSLGQRSDEFKRIRSGEDKGKYRKLA